jgi:hypothetical protein
MKKMLRSFMTILVEVSIETIPAILIEIVCGL